MSGYTGKCVSRLTRGEIIDVFVVDPTGHGLTLTPSEYEKRGITPPIEQLPDCNAPENPESK